MKKSQKTKVKPEKDSELLANDSGTQDSQVSSHFNNSLSAEDLNVIFEYAPDAYYLFDLMGYFVDGNLMAEKLSGYKRDELIGKSFLKLTLLSQGGIIKAAKLLYNNARGKPTGPTVFVFNRKDGSKIELEVRTHPVKIGGRKLVLGIARDISARKKIELEIIKL
ncbi:MAG: PAS domain S-box protein, partial [Candidatus Marinimicrobia bacterium]|nr:PAS domain S-box protein [Candidatus Neomarinimicrobiota bacterium]